MEETIRNENAGLGSGPLIPTWFRLSLPVVLGSIVTIVYNLADTYFIAQTGNALLIAGVSVCAPIFMILMAFGNIFGQGGSSLVSRLMGRKRPEDVQRVSAFCFWIALRPTGCTTSRRPTPSACWASLRSASGTV